MNIKNFFKKDELKLLWPFYIDSLLLTILFIYPAFFIIYFKNIGWSLFQIGLLGSALYVSSLIFEIPTGSFADIYGRKLSTLLGTFLAGISAILLYFFNDFYIILLLFFLWGLGGTFISGARDAWIVDLLKERGRKELIQEYYIKGHSFSGIGLFLSGILGAFLVGKFGLSIIWISTGVSIILTGLVYLFPSESSTFSKNKREGIFTIVKKSMKYSYYHKGLFAMWIMTLFMAFVSSFAGDITWYPLIQGFGFRDAWFGYFFSLTFALSVFIPYFIKPLTKIVGGYVKYLVYTMLGMLIVLLGTIFINNLVLAVLFGVLFFTSWDFFHPARKYLLQGFIPSKMRATIGSLESFIFSIGVVISSPLAGYIADRIGVKMTLFIGSFLVIPAIIAIYKIRGIKHSNFS